MTNNKGDHMTYIMVLNDGETFTDLAGCRIVAVPDDSTTDQIELLLHDHLNGYGSPAETVVRFGS